MALGPCRECGKQVSDQADVCPGCGIKNPVMQAGLSGIGPGVSADDPILKLSGVIVTRTLAKFPSQTFPINGIGSVTLVPPRRGGWVIAAVLLGLAGVGGLTGASFGEDPGNGAGVGLCLLFGIGALWIGLAKKPGLFIKTASGDVKAMESDRKTLNTIKDAIERAATMRG